MSPALQRTLHWVGNGLALTGIAFVALRLHEYRGSLDVSQITAVAWVTIAGLAMLYGVANLLLALAWLQLLAQFGVQVTRLWSIRVYGVSQLAKYVPGNIFHLAGRQAIGMAAGASSGVPGKSILWELGLIALSGMLYGWLVLPLLAPGFPSLASIIPLLGTVWVVAYLLRRFIGSHVSVSFGCQMLFLAISGGVVVTLLNVIDSGSELPPQTWLVDRRGLCRRLACGIGTPGSSCGN